MTALGQAYQDQRSELNLYKQRYEKLRERVMDLYYPHATSEEFDQLVDKQRPFREIFGQQQ